MNVLRGQLGLARPDALQLQSSSGETVGSREADEPLAAGNAAPTDGHADARRGLGGLLGTSAAMQSVYGRLTKAAAMRTPVLIIGENGAGKKRVARTLHQLGHTHNQPFVAAHCGTQDEIGVIGLLDNERLSDSSKIRTDCFERAAGGTLLLHDITQLPADAQLKLLRVLEGQQLPGHPGPREGRIDCRVIATSCADPEVAVREGRLRADLLYRLAAFPICVPPLREREGDAELLARDLLAQLNEREHSGKKLSGESLAWLRLHSWPGNVRELRNAVRCAFKATEDLLDLPSAIIQAVPAIAIGDPDALRVPIGTALSEVERWMIMATLKRCGGNKTRAAAVLGVSLKTLYNRLNEYRAVGLTDDATTRLASILA